MAESRRGLGRGLSALLDEAETGAEGAGAAAAGEGARELPIELIHRNPDQPRTQFAEADLAELADSIREKGVLQPILVRPSRHEPGEYQIVAGERRWRAAQLAGLKAVPALVRELGDNQAFEIAIVENVQRTDLNPLEEANAYSALMGRMNYSQDEAARVVGKSRSHVANTLRLATLPPGVKAHLMAGRLTAGHARAIATAADPEALADLIVSKGLSVREAEALAKPSAANRPKKASGPRRAPKDADTHALEADLEEVLGMAVEILDRGGSGELKIRYATLEQLDELCRRLTRT
jgi:ParB family chromosome partitioning protein